MEKRSQNSKSGKTTRRRQTKREKSLRQIWAVVLFAVGILLLAMALIPGESVWTILHNGVFGLFSFGIFLFAPAIIYIAVLLSGERTLSEIRNHVWKIGLALLLFCGALHVFLNAQPEGKDFIDSVIAIYQDGTCLKNGGLFGAILGTPLRLGCGDLPAKILIGVLIFVYIMLLTGAKLIDLIRTAAKPVKKIQQSYEEHVAANRTKESRFDIDVDLGPEKKQVDIPLDGVGDPLPSEPIPMPEEPSVPDEKKVLDDLIKKAQAEEAPLPILETDTNDQLHISTETLSSEQYVFPPISLLKLPRGGKNKDSADELKANGERLVETLKSFGVQTRIIDISRGPTVTRYELQPSAGVKISKITNLADDIALNLATAGVRIEAPIPNKAAVGIEVPNRQNDVVSMREIIDSRDFEKAKGKLSVALGRDISGKVVLADLAKMPHTLIAGATGSGKSVCINSLIISILYKATPDEVKLLMIDPKVVELGNYNGIPHLLVPVVTDPRKAAGALSWAVTEMLNRYKLFADSGVRDLEAYNEMARNSEDTKPLPQIVIIIDELADLMMAAPNEVEDAICRLAQMARAAGMHLVIATQRPSVDVITGVIKANIPSRIAFAVSSQIDSRTILDGSGAEKLLGRGDMLFAPVGMPKPIRVQGCFVTNKEIEQIVEFVKHKETVDYDENIISEIEKNAVKENSGAKSSVGDGGGFDEDDEMLTAAIECVVEAGEASTSFLQRKLRLGYARAARIIDRLEEKGIIGPMDGSKRRQVLITRQQWIERNLNQSDS